MNYLTGEITMEQSESIAALAAALAIAQLEIGGAVKGKSNPAFKSKYADLSSVWDAWQAVGPAQGLAVIQMPGAYVNNCATVTTIIAHKSGEWMRETLSIPVSKQDAQGYGSALTYARRYALAAFVGIAPEDDDGNAAVAAGAPAKPVWPEGPHPNKTALQAAWKALCYHLDALTTPDDIEAAIDDAKPMLAQFRAAARADILRRDYEGFDDFKGVTQTLSDARARVANRAEYPTDTEGVPLAEPEYPDSVKHIIAAIGNRETKKALADWHKMNAAAIEALDDHHKAIVRATYAARLSAINAMDTVTA